LSARTTNEGEPRATRLAGGDSGAPVRAWRIALISFVALSLELALIRQVPAEVRAISYFTNLVLMSCFLGLGLGCILQQRRRLFWPLPLGLALVLGYVLLARGIVMYDAGRSVHFWLIYGDLPGRALQLPLLPGAIAAFVCCALPFVTLGQALARAMDVHPRLTAYSWDVAGSLLGTVLFSATALLQLPPWAWIAATAALAAPFLGKTRRERVALVAAGLGFLVLSRSPIPGRWSPYYYVQHLAERGGLAVFVNSSFHQFAVDFASGDPALRGQRELLLARWSRPYQVYQRAHGTIPRRVLILGAGTGNDVVVALRNGAERIVAVEIDPVILELGRSSNRSRPYQDPRVTAVLDDARHFLRSSREEFDLIVFGTLDSQVLLSGHGNLRLENYVYTRESLTDARGRLAPGGVLAVYYSVWQDWLFSRLYSTVAAVFGDEVVMIVDDQGWLFDTTIMAGRGVAELRSSPKVAAALGSGIVSTDDWPFVYLRTPTVGRIYVQLLAIISALVLFVFLLLRRVHPVTGLHANFLFLGLGFTLMESSAVVRLALLFGSTWLVNAVVFSAALATIFVANAAVMRGHAPPLRVAWATLFVSLLVNYAFPVSALFAVPAAARALAAALLVGVPVFCAALCFSHLFAREPVTGYPLGVNLVGAMAGGLVEYMSMATGMRAVWLMVLIVYLLAFAFTRRAARRAG
jgi:SAM-dependent methyltransferase